MHIVDGLLCVTMVFELLLLTPTYYEAIAPLYLNVPDGTILQEPILNVPHLHFISDGSQVHLRVLVSHLNIIINFHLASDRFIRSSNHSPSYL